MDFSQPYRVITPTLEGPILRALATAEASLTRAQILTVVDHASEAGIRKALARLVQQGIVLEERIGSRYTYRAHREHLLWPSVEGFLSARRLLSERIRQHTAGWTIPPVCVELFGSVAQGEAHEDSDIDLLVVSPPLNPGEEDDWDSQVGDLQDQVVRWTGNSCDIVVLDPTEVQEAHENDEPVLQAPRIHIAGVPLQRLTDSQAPVTSELAESMRLRAGQHAASSHIADALEEAAIATTAQQNFTRLLTNAHVTTHLATIDLARDQHEALRQVEVLPQEALDRLAVAARQLRAEPG